MSARQIEVEILHVLDRILHGVAVRPVLRIFLQVAEPPVVFLPTPRPCFTGAGCGVSPR